MHYILSMSIGWPVRLRSAATTIMADPVAEKSTFLRMYMSNHPDTLVAYAKWFGKVEEAVKSAEMSYIDCKVCLVVGRGLGVLTSV